MLQKVRLNQRRCLWIGRTELHGASALRSDESWSNHETILRHPVEFVHSFTGDRDFKEKRLKIRLSQFLPALPEECPLGCVVAWRERRLIFPNATLHDRMILVVFTNARQMVMRADFKFLQGVLIANTR